MQRLKAAAVCVTEELKETMLSNESRDSQVDGSFFVFWVFF